MRIRGHEWPKVAYINRPYGVARHLAVLTSTEDIAMRGTIGGASLQQ